MTWQSCLRIVFSGLLLASLGLTQPAQRAASAPAHAGASFASEQLFGPYNDWEPTVATDPSSTWVYQAVTSINPGLKACKTCPDNAIQFRASKDSGETWGRTSFLCPCPGIAWQYDPQLRVATDGTVYAVFLNTFNPGPVLLKSSDHGLTWTPPLRVDGSLSYGDKPVLVISPSGKDVYVAFNDAYATYVSASHNYGASFLPAVRTNGSEHLWWYTYGGAMAPDGHVYFAQSGETGRHFTGPQVIAVLNCTPGLSCRSTALGLSDTPPGCPTRGCYQDFFAAQAAVAADGAGDLVFVYSRNTSPEGSHSLYARTSRDGISWSSPTLVNDADDSNFPAIASGPTPGDFRLAWEDNRNGNGKSEIGGWNVWFSRSVDTGETWAPSIRLSDRSSGTPYKRAAGYLFPHGDYFGLSVDATGVNFLIWGEAAPLTTYCCGGSWYTKGR